MTLAPGVRFGTYEVLEPLGAGAMGEVYRARDSRLGRDVALKVLPEHLSLDAQRLARFEREARVLASLNHPNIATLYGLEESTGAPALVLELVEGETLADRLGSDARPVGLPIHEALEMARQIAGALEAAHEHGVIHRDLKPSNIALRQDGTVKILDFGLAKALERAEDGVGPGSATVTANAAAAFLGTPAYMSPEQARGLAADERSDIWAFGCVLYEMLTGLRAFGGDRSTDVIAKVIERDPDLAVLPSTTPTAIRTLLRRCLEKDPRRRLRDIADARFDLEQSETPPRADARPRLVKIAMLVAGVAGTIALAAAAASLVWQRPPSRAPILFTIEPPPMHVLDGAPVPSPSGDRFAFVATASSGESALWLRSLDSPVPRRVPGTEGASRPFWSPDGRFVGFGTDGDLKRVDPDGGPVQSIAAVTFPFTGAAWNRDGVILFAPTNRAPLHRVAAAGGTPEPLTALDAERGENSHRFPQFLPDGRHFLFTARAALPANTGIYVGSLDSSEAKLLVAAQSSALYVPRGFLLFVRDGALLAQRFDSETLELTGDVRALYGAIPHETQGASASFATSADGSVLAWGAQESKQLTWFDRSGANLGVAGPSGDFEQLRLAPDGGRAAVVMPDRGSGNRDIWVVELGSGVVARVTSHPANDWFPVWSPDGRELMFASDRDEIPSFYRTGVNTAGNEELVYRLDATLGIRDAFPTDWSADGRRVVFHSFPQTPDNDGLWVLPLVDDRRPVALVQGPFTDWIGSFSPDGLWLAYVSDESGSDEIYVRAVETPARFRVSTGGGSQPRWRRDGRELFFVGPDNRLMAAAVAPGPEFAHSPPQPLFLGCGSRPVAWEYHYDVSPDGGRSLWSCPGAADAATVAIDWGAKLDDFR